MARNEKEKSRRRWWRWWSVAFNFASCGNYFVRLRNFARIQIDGDRSVCENYFSAKLASSSTWLMTLVRYDANVNWKPAPRFRQMSPSIIWDLPPRIIKVLSSELARLDRRSISMIKSEIYETLFRKSYGDLWVVLGKHQNAIGAGKVFFWSRVFEMFSMLLASKLSREQAFWQRIELIKPPKSIHDKFTSAETFQTRREQISYDVGLPLWTDFLVQRVW